MSENYLAVVSCAHCQEMITTKPDGTIFCACTTKRPCKHPEGMGECHNCTIDDLQAQVERLRQERLSLFKEAARRQDRIVALNAERDEANRQLAAVVEVLESLQSSGKHVASCIGAPNHMKEQGCVPNCLNVQRVLADIPEAAKRYSERAEGQAAALRQLRELLPEFGSMDGRVWTLIDDALADLPAAGERAEKLAEWAPILEAAERQDIKWKRPMPELPSREAVYVWALKAQEEMGELSAALLGGLIGKEGRGDALEECYQLIAVLLRIVVALREMEGK